MEYNGDSCLVTRSFFVRKSVRNHGQLVTKQIIYSLEAIPLINLRRRWKYGPTHFNSILSPTNSWLVGERHRIIPLLVDIPLTRKAHYKSLLTGQTVDRIIIAPKLAAASLIHPATTYICHQVISNKETIKMPTSREYPIKSTLNLPKTTQRTNKSGQYLDFRFSFPYPSISRGFSRHPWPTNTMSRVLYVFTRILNFKCK